MSDELINVSGVAKEYRIGAHSVTVLKSAELTVAQGESVAVTGMSGAGKSTLLHILGGLQRPDAGAVLYRGQDIYRISAAARTRWRAQKAGFVFQSYHLLPEMDVLENVLLAARTGVVFRSGRAARARADDLLKEVGLSARAHHLPQELSGGEQQRVALARALVNAPELVLADEPTGNLDPETGRQVMRCLLDLTEKQGHSLIMVTHDPRIAELCDRSLRIEDGVICQEVPA